MLPALVCVAAAALCSGAATVLQAVAVRRLPVQERLEAGLLVRLASSRVYLLALVLVALGFALSFWALRTLPLFLVQAGRASSLAVAAVLAVVVLGARLSKVEVAAVATLGAGLVVLASSVAPQEAQVDADGARAAMLGGVAVVLGGAALAVRVRPQARAGVVLAVLAGAAFALLAVGARTLDSFSPADLVADPGAWAMVVAGAAGLVLGALALQRAAVVVVTAVMVGVETCLGAGLGMVLAGDRPEPGSAGAAVAAFVLVLAGALAVARFGTPDQVTAASLHDNPPDTDARHAGGSAFHPTNRPD
ncbi:hypothetical protein [Cellulomonas chengniuliangii]|uniref:hypothetical protein n=1 Tax=Cellulomonas chengniuliangii TaxID=2968084 RepID=UPI001D0E2715|nr:hypothetical protein [Cellulomonas chengniuliangii]MCC2316922.1 hypothetical protein [Cellulomonas chengniuliangii]